MDTQLLAASYTKLKSGTLWSSTGKCKGFAVANPGEAAKIDQFVAAIVAGGAPAPPVLATATGQGIVGMLQAELQGGGQTGPAPPPPGTWPASYLTGPLGANNILPATATGAILGLHSIVQGFTAQQQRDLTAARIADCGRNFDVIHQFGNPNGNSWTGLAGWEDWVHGLGGVPMITIQGITPTPTVAAVNAGSCDAAYAACANFLKTKPYRIMVRIFHEFNGNWFPWSVTTLAAAPAFVTAWQRIVGIFQSNGASNCGFSWSPAEGQDRAIADACYPGNTYIDWVSPDAYNANDAGFSSPYGSGWSEFWQVFGYTGFSFSSTYARYQARKPFIPAETGSKYDSGDANHKANWYRNIATVAKPTYLPNLHGIVFFDADVQLGEGQTWRVDEKNDSTIDATTYQGFKDFSHDPAWNVGVQGGAS